MARNADDASSCPTPVSAARLDAARTASSIVACGCSSRTGQRAASALTGVVSSETIAACGSGRARKEGESRG